jgi:hypothetical protein
LDQEQQDRLRRLVDRILDARDRVSELQEEATYKTQDVATCRQEIEAIAAEYGAILELVPEVERNRVEIRYGRQVIDLRRHASWIPESSRGTPVKLATDDQWSRFGGGNDELVVKESAAAPIPPQDLTPSRSAAPSGPSVGGEVEAWCGSCKDLRGHTIVAIVNEQPKQVICLSCGAKHGFRLTPARGKKKTPAKKKGKLTREEMESLRKEEERTALQKELTEAKDVREFSKKARYRAGEIIEHPEYGRGKIENVIKGSILVRFRSGLRPISMY